MTSFLRKIVSGPKARHIDPDLKTDLDLAYITDRLIIMGFPASGVEALYRNDRRSVRHFLDSHHKGKYRIYNLCPCAENKYEASFFDGRVSRFPWPDHHAPPLSLIQMFVVDMTAWLDSDPENVGVIHCKAGKGRSGTMACSYLLSLPTLPSAPSDEWKLGQRKTRTHDKEIHKQAAEASSASSALNRTFSQNIPAKVDPDSLNETPATAASETIDLDARLREVFELHTSRRLRSKPAQEQSLDKAFIDQGPAGADSASSSRASSIDETRTQQKPDDYPSRRDRLKALGARPSGKSSADELQDSTADPDAHQASSGTDSDEDNLTAQAYGKSAVPRWAVSIPSQRRFVGYWARVLSGVDARSSLLTGQRSSTKILRIDVDRLLASGTSTSDTGNKASEAITIQLARFNQDFETRLIKWEQCASKGDGQATADEVERVRAFDWGDTDAKSANKGEPSLDYFAVVRESGRKSVVKESEHLDDGRAAQTPRLIRHTFFPGDASTTTQSASSVPTWAKGGHAKVPQESERPGPAPGIVVDADRGLLIKILAGRSGKSHSLLPDLASCGYVWFIPAFESPDVGHGNTQVSHKVRCTFGPGEIDFRKGKRIAKILGGEILRITIEWQLPA